MRGQRRIRVALCSPLAGLGGGETSLLALGGELQKRGHHPVLVCPQEGRLTEAAEKQKLEVVVTHFGYPPRIGGLWVPSPTQSQAMLGVLQDIKPHLVHVNDFRPCIHICLAAQLARLPVVWTAHLLWESKNILSREAVRRLCDSVLAVSRFVAQSLLDAAVIPQDRLRISPLGVDTDRFSPRAARRELLAQWGVTPAHRAVVSLVRFQKVKDLDLMLDTARALANIRNDVRLLMVGDYLLGDEEEKAYGRHIKERIEADPLLKTTVRQVPFVAAPEELLAASHVYLCASQVETFGQAVVEAMACGLPAVVTDCGGPAETVADGVTGTVVRSRRPEDLAQAISDILDDESLRRQMGENARRRVLDNYSLERFADRVESAYFDLLQGQ